MTSTRVTARYIGMRGDDDPIQPGTIAFIFCLLLIVLGFAGLMMIYVKNHRARVHEFEVELRKRQVLRERERAISMSEAEAEKAKKRRLLEEQDLALRYRHVQGHGGYEDGGVGGSLSPMSPGTSSPYSYSGGGGGGGWNDDVSYRRGFAEEAGDGYMGGGDEGGHVIPPPRQNARDSYAYSYDQGGGGHGGSVLQAPGGAGAGVRLFDPDDTHSIQMAPLPGRPTGSGNYYHN